MAKEYTFKRTMFYDSYAYVTADNIEDAREKLDNDECCYDEGDHDIEYDWELESEEDGEFDEEICEEEPIKLAIKAFD